MRYTEYHADKAVIKDKALLPDAMEKLAKVEDAEETKCRGCKYEECTKQLAPCRFCKRNMRDLYEVDYEQRRIIETGKADIV